MKKFLKVFMLCFVVAFTLVITNVNAGQLPENQPEIGVEDPASDYYSHWQSDAFGGKRLDDTKVVMALTSGFGLRSGFRTPYNATDFEMALDLTYVDPGVVVTTFFGAQGGYISGNGAVLSMDILKHTSEPHKYLVAIQAGSGVHHVGFNELVDPEQGNWEDSAWVGYHVVAEDDVVKISLLDQGENSLVTINGREFTIASSSLYKDFTDKESTYFSIGAMNLDGTIQTVVSNYVFDAYRREYYSTEGAYSKFKSNLTALEAALELDLTVAENVTAAQNIRDLMDESVLYPFDQLYLSPRYEAAFTKLNDAITALGGDIVIAAFQKELEKFEVAAENINDFTSAKSALTLKDSTNQKLAAIVEEELNEEQLATLTSLKARFTTALELVDSNILTLVKNQVTDFESAVADLSTIDKVNAALVAKSNISNELINLLGVEEKTDVESRVATANNTFIEKTATINDGWKMNEKTYAVVNENKIGVTFIGDALKSDNGLFYTKEKFDVRNFEMSFDFKGLTNVAGSWFSFGIMEKPEIFINAEDASVQDNKGLFFLIINQGNGTAKVEVYQMSLYSNRFFDAIKIETLTIDLTKTVDVELGTEVKIVSGVSEEYMMISIGGKKMVSDLITTRAMKTSLADYQGYLYLAGQGGSSTKPNTIEILSINSKEPTAETLFSKYLATPSTSTTTVEYQLESNEDVKVNFDARGLEITKVTIDDVALAANDYTFENLTITIKASKLDQLSEGKKNLVVETEGGSVTVELSIIPVAVVAPEKGLSTGAIIGIVSAVIVVLGGIVAFIVIKRKH